MPNRSLIAALSLATALAAAAPALAGPPRSATLAQLTAQFQARTGARLVFTEGALPRGDYYDRMPTLSPAKRRAAATLLLDEAAKYPAGYLGAMGLDAVGVFAACVSDTGDGFRPYDEALKGYRYYGVWNGRDAIAACYYTDTQLPLTFHHEVFHHVDASDAGATSKADHFRSDDARFARAITGHDRYPAAAISDADAAALASVAEGWRLDDAVSGYAEKHPGEDQAETARHLMTSLADSLLQARRHPGIPGSQRILHVLDQYRRAIDGGPDVSWFVDVALGRTHTPPSAAMRLEALLDRRLTDADLADARALLTAIASAPGGADLRTIQAAAALTPQLVRQRTRASDGDTRFTVWRPASYSGGGNTVLRDDVLRFADDAARLSALASDSATSASVARAQLAVLRLIARYHDYIGERWPLSDGTKAVFASARDRITQALPRSQRALHANLATLDFSELSRVIQPDGAVDRPPLARPSNPYLANVDDALEPGRVRAAIRSVQPATVRIGGGSGVNLAARGLVLTNAHVAKALNTTLTATFPDGSQHRGTAIAIDDRLDLALVRLDAAGLPTAPVAADAPSAGDAVVAIGQPGRLTPGGEPTGYQPFHVSTGVIRGFLPNPLGDQSLGRTKHDAWTYWGHSGSPLFNADGAIVALHNSWDSTTAMRHAVPHQAIVHFLDTHDASYAFR